MNGFSYDFRAPASTIVPHGLNGARLGDPVSLSLDAPFYVWLVALALPAFLIGYGIYSFVKK